MGGDEYVHFLDSGDGFMHVKTYQVVHFKSMQHFPGGAVVESACQCRGHGFDPWSGKIPHAVEQLSPCATTTETVL